MKKILFNNRVIISGIMSAALLTLQQLLSKKETDLKVIGFAVFIAVLSVIAQQWKGHGVTVTGILGTLAGVAVDIQQTGTFTWNEFVMSALIAMLTAVSSNLRPERHPRAKKRPQPFPVINTSPES